MVQRPNISRFGFWAGMPLVPKLLATPLVLGILPAALGCSMLEVSINKSIHLLYKSRTTHLYIRTKRICIYGFFLKMRVPVI